MEPVFGQSGFQARPLAMFSVFPLSSLAFLYIYTEDKIFIAKTTHIGVSEEESGNAHQGAFGKATHVICFD